MSKTKSTRLSSTQRFRRSKLTDAVVDFCSEYMLLTIPDRRKVEHFLLQQALLPAGTDAYRHPGHMYYEPDVEACVAKLALISSAMTIVWFAWALEISKTRPSRVACCENIFGLLSKLVYGESFERYAERNADTAAKTTV
jgi:hypothetical protein